MPDLQSAEKIFEDARDWLELGDVGCAAVHRTGLLPVQPLVDAVRTEGVLAPAAQCGELTSQNFQQF